MCNPISFDWLQDLDFWTGLDTLGPAALFAVSVAVFGFMIFHLHQIMARRDVLGRDIPWLRKWRPSIRILALFVIFVIRYIVVFPFIAYLWFLLLVVMVAFLYSSKEPSELLLIAMAVLTSIRVTCYYREDLSRDIAKILPYGLLGAFLVSFGQLDPDQFLDLLIRLRNERESAFYYWVFVVLQELALHVSDRTIRMLYAVVKPFVGKQTSRLRRRNLSEPGS